MSDETLIFFLIRPYKLNVIATVKPIHGNSFNLIKKESNDVPTNITEIVWLKLSYSFKNNFPKKTLIIG